MQEKAVQKLLKEANTIRDAMIGMGPESPQFQAKAKDLRRVEGELDRSYNELNKVSVVCHFYTVDQSR